MHALNYLGLVLLALFTLSVELTYHPHPEHMHGLESETAVLEQLIQGLAEKWHYKDMLRPGRPKLVDIRNPSCEDVSRS